MGVRRFSRQLARGLTLGRLACVPLFVVLLVHTAHTEAPLWRLSLLLLYAGLVLSDFYDGRLARQAGAASPGWGQLDALADIVLNTCGLAAAAWIGRLGPWVAAGVAVLGGRFLWRNLRRAPTPTGRLVEDRAGKAAGVLYYLLVGAVVAEVALVQPAWRWSIARLGDGVFGYTLFLLLRRRRPTPPGASASG